MKNLKLVLLNELRKNLFDPASRGTSQTDLFDGTDSQTVFTLTKNSLMFIDSVKISSVAKKLIRDFTIDFGESNAPAKITFLTAPAEGIENIEVKYKYGENWVYDDQPHFTAKMPRISLLNIGGSPEKSGGVTDKIVFYEPAFRLGVWIKTGKDYTINGYKYSGSKLLDYINTDVEEVIRLIRNSNLIENLIDLKISPPTYLGLDEEYMLKRTERTINSFYQKSYG
jgi:hypothetical protein